MHDRKIDPAIKQRTIRRSSIRGVDSKGNTRVRSRNAGDHVGNKTLSYCNRGPDRHLSVVRIKKEAYVFDAM
jgi:hypothetical protein